MNFLIRREEEKDYRVVEELTREAFWNLYVQGCDEHYLVHIIRKSKDFIKELDFVAVLDGKIVGNIMFSKSHVEDEKGTKHETITFGPLSVLPEYQKKGVGKTLIEHAKEEAKKLGYKAILIFGNPAYYSKYSFKASKEFNISIPGGKYPAAFMVLGLYEDALDGVSGTFYGSKDFEMNPKDIEEFDKSFPHKEKKFEPSQKDFEKICSTFL